MRKYRNKFTLIELLLVIGIMAILMAVGATGLRNISGGAGITGTVRNLSSQLSLARSYAASRNRFVAVLLPDGPAVGLDNKAKDGNDATSGFTSDADKIKLFHQSRLCFVSYTSPGVYKFDSWIDDNSWVKWDAGIAVFAKDKFVQVKNISGKDSTAIVFANSGALISDEEPDLRVLRARYNPDKNIFMYSVEGEKEDSSWKLTINPFTGRTSFEKLY
jgi:prepilin-type N-terminal cleavage/methylation domain-containing protein